MKPDRCEGHVPRHRHLGTGSLFSCVGSKGIPGGLKLTSWVSMELDKTRYDKASNYSNYA